MPLKIEGFLDDGHGEPLAGIPAVVTRLSDGAAVLSGATDADGHWVFTSLPTADEYVVTLSDSSGNAVSRAPWSGEMRELYVRDRLDVDGLPVVLDPAAGNSLLWTATGLYAPTGITLAAADLRYEPIDTMYTKAESDARYPQKTDVDPYPNYLTSTEADALFLTPAEGNAAYAALAHNHDTTYVQLTGGSVMTGLLGPTTTNTRDLGTTALRWRKLWAVDGEFTNAPTVGGVAVLTATSAGLLYEPIDTMYTKAEDDARFVNLAGGSVMTGLLGPTTTNTRDLGTTTLRWRKLWAVDGDLSGALTVTTGPLTVSAGGIAVTGASTFSVAPTVGGSSLLTATAGDTAYVNVGGDTMTGALNLVSTNWVNKLTDPAFPAAYAGHAGLIVQHEGTTPLNGLSLARAAGDVNYETLNFWRARGTWASKAAIANADYLSQIGSWAWSGSQWLQSTAITSQVTGTVSTTATPSTLSFWTANSAGAVGAKLTIGPGGEIGMGAKADGTAFGTLDVQAATATYAAIIRAHASTADTLAFFSINNKTPATIFGTNNLGWVTDVWSATAIGSYATKRIPVYNAAGTLQGYLPLYT
jgi:hypothetical protein